MVERSDDRRSPVSRNPGLLARLFGGGVAAITPAQAHPTLGTALFLDVRETSEFRAGHVPGALHIPLGQLHRRLGELGRDRSIVAVCRSGNRSGAAARMLAAEGYQVENLGGGMIAWTRAGLPVRTSR